MLWVPGGLAGWAVEARRVYVDVRVVVGGRGWSRGREAGGPSVSLVSMVRGSCGGRSSGARWWCLVGLWTVEPAMHVYLWDAKGNKLYMRPLIQQLRDKGISLTAKPLGF